MNSTGRLFIADPSLKDARGHHYSLTKSISDAASGRGLRTIWLGSKELTEDFDRSAEVIPTFQSTMYDAYMRPKSSTKPQSFLPKFYNIVNRLLAKRKQEKSRSEAPSPALDLADQLLRDLNVVFDQNQVGAHDHLLFHTADGATFEAVSRLVAENDANELPTIHVCTPYDPEGVMPNRKNAAQLVQCVEVFRRFETLGDRVKLYAENQILAEHLSKVWTTNVETLGLPAKSPDPDLVHSGRRYREDNINIEPSDFLAISLGAARLEKGFDLLPDIIEYAYEIAETGAVAPVDARRLKFVLHASPQIIGRHPRIVDAIDRLRAFPDHQVKLLLEPLPDHEYRNLTLASDCILMPYDVAAYRVRGSGIVTEAIVAKKPILAKTGSYPAAMATTHGGETGETAYEMACALIKLMHERHARAPLIDAAAAEYLIENSPDQYIKKIWPS